MKKNYESPRVMMELFELTQQTGDCAGIQINSTDTICVLMDSDSTVTMRDFAFMGGFLTLDVCSISVPDPSQDALCYHTSSAMAFTS